MSITGYTTMKVFCATRSSERDRLGEKMTAWLVERPYLEVVDQVVTQSSDDEYHCLSIWVFLKDRTLTEEEKFDAMGEEIERHPIGGGGRRFGS